MGRSRRTRLPRRSTQVGGDAPNPDKAKETATASGSATIPALLDDLCAIGTRELKIVELLTGLHAALPPVWRDVAEPSDAEERLRRVLAPHADRLVPRLHHLVRTNDGLLIIEIAAMFLPYFGRPGAAALLDLLDHPDWSIRRVAGYGIARFGPSEAWAVRHLCEYLTFHGWALNMRTIEQGLRNIGPTEDDEMRDAALALQAERHRRWQEAGGDDDDFFKDLGSDQS